MKTLKMPENNKYSKNQIRCSCGKLYLIRTAQGYEFKCPRCKQVRLIRYEELMRHWKAGNKRVEVSLE